MNLREIVLLAGTHALVQFKEEGEFSSRRDADLRVQYDDDLRPLLFDLASTVTENRGAGSDPVHYYQSDPGAQLRTRRESEAPHRHLLGSPEIPVTYITRVLEYLTSNLDTRTGRQTWLINRLPQIAARYSAMVHQSAAGRCGAIPAGTRGKRWIDGTRGERWVEIASGSHTVSARRGRDRNVDFLCRSEGRNGRDPAQEQGEHQDGEWRRAHHHKIYVGSGNWNAVHV